MARGQTIKRHLPASLGGLPLYVSPDAALQYLKPGKAALNPHLLQIAHEEIRADSIVWDIGACVGVFTFAAASITRTGSVVAVEPDIWLAHLILRSHTLRQNRSLNVTVLPVAVSDKDGVASFLIAERGRSSNALEFAGGRSQMGGARMKLTVPTLRLDTMLNYFDQPSFIKIDVEGAEIVALLGAKRILTEVRPLFYIEVDEEQTSTVTQIFSNANYVLFDGSLSKSARQPIDRCVFDTLAIPSEMV
jgi:FkbM family methyltransferase